MMCLLLAATACGGNSGAVSIEESAELYNNGRETMTIKGALVFEYDTPMLCSGVVQDDDSGTPLCESPGYHIVFKNGLSPAIAGMELQGDGYHQWVEDVSFHGTLNEGVFTVDE
jgi:hypothetical protein